jgi:hypothetical protein
METRQLEHEGFEHVDEFRRVEIGEHYQSNSGYVFHKDSIDEIPKSQHGGKRWILRKKHKCINHPCTCSQAATTHVVTSQRPPQKCFEGFEHTGEFREVEKGEWFQSNGVNSYYTCSEPLQRLDLPFGKRWILRKVSSCMGNPKREEAIKALEKDLARAQFHVGHAVEDLKAVTAELRKSKEKS